MFGKHTVPGVPCVLITSLVPTTRFPWCAMRAPSQVCCVSPLGRGSQALTLLAVVNRSESQEDLATGSLSQFGGGCQSLGLRFPLAFWFCLSCVFLPLCLWWLAGWEGVAVCSRLALLWYLLNPLFCEQARLRESSLSLFFSLVIPQFALLSHISTLRLFLGHSGLVVTLSMQPAPPGPASDCWCRMQAFGLLLRWEL